MRVQSHRWGYSQILFESPEVCLARAVGLAGGQSSLHTHQAKDNLFFVVAGRVEIWNATAKLATLAHDKRRVMLAPADMPHRMVFVTDAILFELYSPKAGCEVNANDINRRDNGRRPTIEALEAARQAAHPFFGDQLLQAWLRTQEIPQ